MKPVPLVALLPDEEAGERRPPAEHDRAVLRFHTKPTAALGPIPPPAGTVAMWWKRRSSREVFCVVIEQEIDAFGQEAFGVRVQQSASRRISPASSFLAASAAPEGDAPGGASPAGCRAGAGPASGARSSKEDCWPRRPNAACPQICFRNWKRAQSGGEIVLELDAVGTHVQAQRKFLAVAERDRVRRL